LSPKTPSNYAYQLYYLKGAEEFNTSKETDPAKLKALEDKVGVKALDDKTLQVNLKSPTPYFLDLTSFYTYLPVDKKVQQADAKWDKEAKTYVSNGPFTLAEWNHKQSIKLAKNDKYYDKDRIKLNGVDFAMVADENTAWQMYQAGELDLVYPLPQEITAKLKNENNKELVIAPDLSTYFYRFNTTKKPFNNVKVRKALAMAINRTDLVDKVAMGGQTPAFGYTSLGIKDENGKEFQTNNYFKEDLTQAKQLLSEGLKEEGMDLSKFTFTILYNTSEGHKKIAEAIQDMWKKNLGVNVKLENVEFQVKLDREDKLDFEVDRSGWVGDYVDPMTFLDMFVSTGTQNDTGWKNADYDKFIKEAQTSNDQAKRMTAMRSAEKILMDEMPIMPIYYYTKPYTVKSNVTGLYDVVNRYPQYKYVEIK
jgi:oligopeptide transport system substrate-binding protein